MHRTNRCKRARQWWRETKRERRWAEEAYDRDPSKDRANAILRAVRAERYAWDDLNECRHRAYKRRHPEADL